MARQVAVDAFGNALGNGLAEMSGRGSTSGLQAASGGFPLYADSSGRLEPVIVTATPWGDDDEVKAYYGDRLIQSFFDNTQTGRAATGLGDGPRQPSPSVVGTSTDAAPERRGMSIDRPAAYLPGRGAGARLGQMYDVNIRRDPTRSVLAQPTGDEAGDRAIRELRLQQQALQAPPIDPTIDLPLIVAGPAVQAARWLGRTALGSTETVAAKFLAPRGLGNTGNGAVDLATSRGTWGGLPASPAAQGFAGQLVRPGDMVPLPRGAMGLQDLGSLASSEGAEFAVIRLNGERYIVRGTANTTTIPESSTLIGHVHPGEGFMGLAPSVEDMSALGLLNQGRSAIFNESGAWRTFGPNGPSSSVFMPKPKTTPGS
jgi:hypothetical protein